MGRALSAEEVEETAAPPGGPWRTLLFNCDCHTFDEVERVVMMAVNCTLSRARQISHEVHTRGSASACEGSRARCEAAADVIAAVGLRVRVCQAPDENLRA